MKLPFNGSLRRLDPREASDAGLLHWRENIIFFIFFFAIPFWIFAFALRMLPGRMQYLSWFILWWLKPLFDRPVLHVISVRFFEPDADIKKIFNTLFKNIKKGLAGDLLWRRFSLLRSAVMPIYVLEADKSAISSGSIIKRKNFLKQNGLSYCSFLSIWGIAAEIVLLAGEVMFAAILMQLTGRNYFSFSREFFINAEIYLFAAWCFNYMLVETIYVCMGFSLYINSRIEVEGWDLEILFRGFAEKLKNKKIPCVLAVIIFLSLFSPVISYAEEDNVPLESLQQILNSPEFGGETTFREIRLKRSSEQGNGINFSFTPISEKLRLLIAYTLRFMIIISFIILALFLILYSRKIALKNYRKKAKKYSFGALNDTEPDNPGYLLEKALSFYEQGNIRMAWGYCTASAIYSWKSYRNIDFPPGATERECADIISSNASCSEEANTFNNIINNWIKFAYAGIMPQEENFEEAAAFCKSFNSVNGQING